MKIIERTFNAETGETTDIERKETAQEKAKREAFEIEVAQLKAEAEAKAATRQALLTRLGITEDEAKILLGGN
jgi:hypothetical protein